MPVSLFRVTLALIVSAALLAPTAFASRVHRAPTSGQSTHKSSGKSSKSTAKSTKSSSKSSSKTAGKSAKSKRVSRAVPKKRGQQAIDPDRVTEIQQALIREHYLSGDASGKWDSTTQAAMQKFQSDQGWQQRLTPDSRALKKLGLGPDYSNAINVKDSSFAPPPPVSTIPTEQASGFASAAGVNP
jgi:hypothetical protein